MRTLLGCLFILLVAASASGIPLDLTNPNGIAAVYVQGNLNSAAFTFIVCTDGRVYFWGPGMSSWTPTTAAPVPVAEVVDWTPWSIKTRSGQWFWRPDVLGGADRPWVEISASTTRPAYYPPFFSCYDPTRAEPGSLGSLKSQFR